MLSEKAFPRPPGWKAAAENVPVNEGSGMQNAEKERREAEADVASGWGSGGRGNMRSRERIGNALTFRLHRRCWRRINARSLAESRWKGRGIG